MSVGIIADGITIEGNIIADDSLVINGNVNGNVIATNDLRVTGEVTGDICANTIITNGAKIKGNINSKNEVIIEENSIIIGDITGINIKVSGAIKGEIHADEQLTLKKSAIVMGNIESKNIELLPNAVLDGKISKLRNESDKDIFNVFDKIDSEQIILTIPS